MRIDMGDEGHPDAEAIVAEARSRVQARYDIVLGVSVHGDHAVVVLAPGREPGADDPEPPWENHDGFVEFWLWREDAAWLAAGSDTGGGHSIRRLHDDADLSTHLVSEWGPGDARAAEVRFLGTTYEVPSRHGGFVFVAWDVPALEGAWELSEHRPPWDERGPVDPDGMVYGPAFVRWLGA